MKTHIHVTTSFVGVHRWPDARGQHAYLANPHRHVFQVDVWVQVMHDDRELEFFAVQDFVSEELPHFHMGALSCEQVATEILRRLLEEYGGHREVDVEVSEDGENGAMVEWKPDELTTVTGVLKERLYGPDPTEARADETAIDPDAWKAAQRANVLEEANEIVDGDRQEKYGHPLDNFEHTAALLNGYFGLEYQFTAEDVAYIQILLKLSRQRNFPLRDNLVDIAGYSRTVEKVQDERDVRQTIAKSIMEHVNPPGRP